MPRQGPTHTMETEEANLMEISECSPRCLRKVSQLDCLPVGVLLVIPVDRQEHMWGWLSAWEEIGMGE